MFEEDFYYICLKRKKVLYNEIYTSIENGDLDKIKLLLQEDIDLNKKNEQGDSFIHFAISKNQISILKLLLRENIDIEIKNSLGETPLEFALKNNNTEAMKVLIKKGANFKDLCINKHFSFIHLIVSNGNVEILELILEKGVNINEQEKISGMTPLHIAFFKENKGILDMLLKFNANIYLEDYDGNSPISLLSKHKVHYKIEESLLNYKYMKRYAKYDRFGMGLTEGDLQYYKEVSTMLNKPRCRLLHSLGMI